MKFLRSCQTLNAKAAIQSLIIITKKKSFLLKLNANGPVLCARWRFKALTFNLLLMMIEAQMFNLPLHRHWRKTPVTGWCGLIAQIFNYARK